MQLQAKMFSFRGFKKKYLDCSLNSPPPRFPIQLQVLTAYTVHIHVQHAKRCRDVADNHQDSSTTVCNQVPMWTETHLIRLPEFIFKNDCYWALAHNYKSLFLPYIFRWTRYDIIVLSAIRILLHLDEREWFSVCWLLSGEHGLSAHLMDDFSLCDAIVER